MHADTALLLLNLGGPVNQAQVKPFLRELFSDRDLVKFPGPAWLQPIFARLISHFRAESARARYREIGGGSPLLRLSAFQATALRQALRARGIQSPVKLVFRTTQPRAERVLANLAAQGIRRILPVSLYPHDCKATTGSSLRELQRLAPRFGLELAEGVLHYATDSDYLASLEGPIRQALAKAPEATVIFSAHSLPLRQILEGDPYEREIQASVEALKARLGELPGGFRLAYQSRVGPVKWLEPNLKEVLAQMKDRDVIIVPLSFVSEHIETLHELDIEYREVAEHLGVKSYQRTPTPGTDPAFISCLERRCVEALGQDTRPGSR